MSEFNEFDYSKMTAGDRAWKERDLEACKNLLENTKKLFELLDNNIGNSLRKEKEYDQSPAITYGIEDNGWDDEEIPTKGLSFSPDKILYGWVNKVGIGTK